MKFIFAFLLLISMVQAKDKPDNLLLTVGEYPPYASEYSAIKVPQNSEKNEQISTENSQGISVFFVKKIFKKMGIKARIHFLPWQLSMIEARKNETFQGSLLWSKTEKRSKDFYFSDPILETFVIFFHRKDKDFSWSQFSDLRELKIGTTLGYTYGKEFDELLRTKQLQNIPAIDIISNLQRLIKGSIDLFPIEPMIGKYYLKKIQNLKGDKKNQLSFNKKIIHNYKLHLILSKKKDSNKEIIKNFNANLSEQMELWGSSFFLRPCFTLRYIGVVQSSPPEKFKKIKELCKSSKTIYCRLISNDSITEVERSHISYLNKSCP